MTTTISSTSPGIFECEPDLVLGYVTASESRNIAHDPISGPTTFTLRPDAMRAGTLDLFFEFEADAWGAFVGFRAASVFTLESDDSEHMAMRFVRVGSMSMELDSTTFAAWVLHVGYQEIAS